MKRKEDPDLTRAEIIQTLHDCLAISRKDAKDILERLLDILSQGLADGERLVLSGLGSFQVKPTPARPGRNPKTGTVANVPAKNRLSFTMSPNLRAALAEWQDKSQGAGQTEYVPGVPGPWGTGPAEYNPAEAVPGEASPAEAGPDGPGVRPIVGPKAKGD